MKLFARFILILFSIIWILALVPYKWFTPTLYKIGVLKDEYRFGDFYHLSSLPQFKEVMVSCTTPKVDSIATDKPIHLYIIGDSFTEPQRMSKEDFDVAKYTYITWGKTLHFKPDTNATNILVLETVERHLRQHIQEEIPNYIQLTEDEEYVQDYPQPTGIFENIEKNIESSKVEGQLGLLMFNNGLAVVFQELKAFFNYKFFNRTNEKTVVSKDGEHIVFYLDTDSTNYPYTSGFSTIEDTYIDSLVTRYNRLTDILKTKGFDHVALSIIPNKSTIVMPEYGTYNHLIERFQGHPNLKTPFVDVLEDYRRVGESTFLKSDSHWTCEGRAIWINNVTKLLKQLAQPKKEKLASSNFDCQPLGSTRSLFLAAQPQ